MEFHIYKNSCQLLQQCDIDKKKNKNKNKNSLFNVVGYEQKTLATKLLHDS